MYDFNNAQLREKILWNLRGSPFMIYREDPLIHYFTDDERCDSILVDESGIRKIGSPEIDSSFTEYNKKCYCSSISYKKRECNIDDNAIVEAFRYPLEKEVEEISKGYLELREIILNRLQSGAINLSEKRLSFDLAASVVSEGYRLIKFPVVAYDESTDELIHNPSDSNIKNYGYIEVIAYKRGISYIFSETVFINEGEYSKEYIEFLKVKDFLRENFITGTDSSYIYNKLKNMRHEKLYLTQPLYPFTSWIMIPGDEQKIDFRVPTVFDLWIKKEKFTLRKKFVVISGYENAIVL